MGTQKSKADRELEAMGKILNAFEGLEGESIQRVLDYVLSRLSLTRPTRTSSLTVGSTASLPVESGSRQLSIRDLKQEKQPGSINQMAALVAFYLSELSPENERKSDIGAAELEKYFKQAGFKLPKDSRNALPNAANAGYFDFLGSGRYRLNPVGYNLVVHGLPRGADSEPTTSKAKRRTGRR
jgi:hypothetical protein